MLELPPPVSVPTQSADAEIKPLFHLKAIRGWPDAILRPIG